MLTPMRPGSECEPGLARRVRERLDTSVIEITAAVEDNLGDALVLGQLGDAASDDAASIELGLIGAQKALNILRGAGDGENRLPFRIVHDLRDDVLRAAPHGEARPLDGTGNLLQDALVAPNARV